MGHRWRWSFEPVGDDQAGSASTVVTETFDFSGLGLRAKMLKATGFEKKNGKGIKESLTRLHRR
jgi:hypothetical protein